MAMGWLGGPHQGPVCPRGGGPRHPAVAYESTGSQSNLPALMLAPECPQLAAPRSSAEEVPALQVEEETARGSTPRRKAAQFLQSVGPRQLSQPGRLSKRGDPHSVSSLQHF